MLRHLPLLLALPTVALAEVPDGATLTSATLDNGLHVTVLADPSLPITATQTWVAVGSAHETADELGFAHLFEHLMFGATTHHAKEDYARLHSVNGGRENAYTNFDNTVYISEIAPDAHPEVLALEADRLRNLILDPENLDNEKKIVTEELRLRTENDPISRLIGAVLAAVFGDHPYAHHPAGTREAIQGADLGLVRKFYDGYYRPANIHLVIVGPVDTEAVMAEVQALYGPLEGERLVPPTVPSLLEHAWPERVELADRIPPIKVTALVFPTPPRTDPAWPAVHLLTEMLSGGSVDRFRDTLVVERHGALEATTLVQEMASGGVIAFGSVSLFRGTGKAFALVRETLDTLDEGAWLTEDALEAARRRLLRDELGRRWYAASLADAIGEARAWQGDEALAFASEQALRDVTLDDVRAAWRRFVREPRPTEVFVHRGRPVAGGED